MENLFIEPIKFDDMSKEASVYLDKDQTTWVKSIMGRFLEKFPVLQNQGIKLVWTKQDPNKGYAVGAIKILGGAVPVIVRDFYLYPMDVIMFGDKALPLTADTLQSILSNPEPFKGIAGSTPKGSLDLFSPDLQMSPTESAHNMVGNTGVTRPAMKYASFIDSIEHVDKDSIKTILSEVTDEAVKNAFKANDNWDVIEKISKKTTESAETEIQSFVRNLEVDRQYSYEDSFGNHIVKSANSNVDHVWSTVVKPEEADSVSNKTAEATEVPSDSPILKGNTYKISDNETLYVSDTNDYHVFDRGIKLAETFDLNEETPQVGDTGTFILNGIATKPFEIASIEKVSGDLGVTLPINNSNDSLYIHQEDNSYGVYFDKVASSDAEKLIERLEGSDPQVGDTGCFIVNGSATKPFEITSMQKNTDAGQWEIETFDGLNKVSYYPIKPKADTLESHELYTNSYYVPGNSIFVKLGSVMNDVEGLTKSAAEKGSVHLTTWDGMKRNTYYLVDEEAEQYADHNFDSSASYIPKNATYVKLNRNIKVTATPDIEKVAHHRIERDGAGLYSLHGPAFEKYAENNNPVRSLLKDDAIWSSIHCGVTNDEIDTIAKMANGSAVDIYSDLNTPHPVKDLSEAVEKGFDERMAEIKIDTNLVKEAAVISDKGTVDAVLSLGLLKKDNVLEFVNLLPQYEAVMGELAKLLIISRLGLSNIPETAVSKAMVALTRVILLLKQINTVHKD
tara:strand:- start:3077 stop:5278 length:2202 start_codon:yes stop_codon:yes gene_type:complete